MQAILRKRAQAQAFSYAGKASAAIMTARGGTRMAARNPGSAGGEKSPREAGRRTRVSPCMHGSADGGCADLSGAAKAKTPVSFETGVLGMMSLTMSYFHWKYNQLSSAIRCFTVLFGMGRSGTTSLWSSGKGFAARAANSLLGQKQS